jgi:hypothetical protein
MGRKVLNNKVEFLAGGESLIMKLSDKELRDLRRSSQWYKGDDWEHMLFGRIHNFAIYALFDYDWKSPYKRGRFTSKFPYRKYDNIDWFLITE